MENPLQARYQLSAVDFLSFYLQFSEGTVLNSFRRRFLFNLFVLAAISFTLLFLGQLAVLIRPSVLGMSALDPAVLISAAIVFAAIALICVAYLLLEKKYCRAMHRTYLQKLIAQLHQTSQIRVGGTTEVVIDADRLTESYLLVEICQQIEKTTQIRTLVPWSQVKNVTVTGKHAFVEMGNKEWLILPKRAFTTEKEFLRFVSTLYFYRDGVHVHEEPESGIKAEKGLIKQ